VKNNPDSVIAMVRDICLQDVEPDGIMFDPQSVRGQVITEEADYEGVRIYFRGSLDNARLTIQMDVGFGDVVIPPPRRMSYPTIFNSPAPQIRGYSMESMIAEKFEAMKAFRNDKTKQSQWKAFTRKNRMAGNHDNFGEVVDAVSFFLKPVIDSIVNKRPVSPIWKAPGPWR